tara:strand:+ start:271 stop:969 length:699 start_codon:yes stop_codon:yes gene_type:complete
MTMTEITSANQPQNGRATTAQKSLANNFDDFLTLLTTQLTNQDPLNPTDTTEFTNQLVNFTNVEQAIATNQNLETLVQLQQMSQQNMMSATMINYLGKSIGTNLNVAALEGGEASWNLSLGSSAGETTYEIYDQNGSRVFSETKDSAAAGAQQYHWDGTKSSGSTASDGVYYLVVNGKTAGGSNVQVDYSFEGIATSVESLNGETVLKIGKVPVGLDYINSVTQQNLNEPSA